MKTCKSCGVDISARRSDADYCANLSCKNERSRMAYKRRERLKSCVVCRADFKGKDKATHCPKCKKLSAKMKSFTVIEQEIRCKHCDALLEKRFKKNTRNVNVLRTHSCAVCKRKNQRASKIGPLNPNWSGGPAPKLTLAEVAELNRERMCRTNPMHNPETVNKARNTTKKRIDNGDISYSRGQDHPLWKGNRKPSFVLRSRLKAWTRSVMERDKFLCQMCGINSKHLEVHHTKPFREIVLECQNALGIGPLNTLDVSSLEFENLSQLVEKTHCLEDGITYCKSCHAKVDALRRIK